VSDDLRNGLLAPRVWPQLVLASVLVVTGHTATFVIAARVAGSTAPLGELVALLMVVQTAVVIPLSVGGWGLREGAAAWAFAAAGLGAAHGVTIATLYAVLMLVAFAPGAGLLLADAIRRRRDPGQEAIQADQIRRRGRWGSFVIDQPHPLTGHGTPLTTALSTSEAERLVP
jgi:hypothetical protein